MNSIVKTLFRLGIGIALAVGLHRLINSSAIASLPIVPKVGILILGIIFAFCLYWILDNLNTLAYINRGDACANRGDYQGAIENYNQAIRLNPKEASGYFSRGAIRCYIGDNQGAIEISPSLSVSLPRLVTTTTEVLSTI